MSHATTTRRKHVLKEMMEDDYSLPTDQQQIVRVVSSRGNNLHEVETAAKESENFLVSMPNKFRKNVWVKRGDFLLVEPIEEGDKVKAEICKILTPEHIKEYTKSGVWPERFAKKTVASIEPNEATDSDSDESLPPNTNRPVNPQNEQDTESDTTDSSSSED